MKIGAYYIRQPAERAKIFLSGGQGSVWQRKTEIPRDSGKRVWQRGCTLFLCPTVVADQDRDQKTGSKGVLEEFDCEFRI